MSPQFISLKSDGIKQVSKRKFGKLIVLDLVTAWKIT
jgi:hypothetical protein